MKIDSRLLLILLIVFSFYSCGSKYYVRQNFTYKKPVDTQTKKIDFQEKKLCQVKGIYADNRFDGARLNDFTQINDTTWQVLIKPENSPINPSPWFAFKLWSAKPDSIYVQIKYVNAKHRYRPKISHDRNYWKAIDTFTYNADSTAIVFKQFVNKNPVWIAAQKIINLSDTQKWIDSITRKSLVVERKVIGKSVLNKDIPYFKIGTDTASNTSVIILMSRQHPPEVTGFMAFQSFVEELTENNALTGAFFQKYEIWVFPILNPDGVDLGHWRHNAGGVDLNRDWAEYRQPEIEAVTDFIVKEAKKHRQKIILGIDFHSTFKDIYYVFDEDMKSVINGFSPLWTTSIDRLIYPFETKYSPFAPTQPVSKNWFYNQFNAEGITYEVGDNTPAKIIDKKARIAVVTMMDLLLQWKF